VIRYALRSLQTRAFQRAWRTRDANWFAIGAALWMVNRAQGGDGVVFRTKLEPGEGLVISTRRAKTPSPSEP
jgi:hypothetical protein